MARLLDIKDLHIEIGTDRGILRPIVGVDLEVDRGETLAIVGESGSGKSLTALSILGLLPRHSRYRAKRFDFNGKSLLSMGKRELQSIRGDRITMIFQDAMTALDPCYRIGAQMTEVLRQHRRMTRAAAKARALELLDTVQVSPAEERFDQYPHELSGGLRQRVMIAMALLCEPDLLVADEPTTALDATVQVTVLNLLAQIQAKTGVGLILITHDIGVVAKVAERTAVMYRGQIVESGDTEAILQNPLHPYTEGLLRSIPVPGRVGRRQPLGYIPGTVPIPDAEPIHCAFAPRCPYATEACWAAPIPLRSAPDGRQVRCILPLDGTGRTPDAWVRGQETVA